MKFLQLLLLAAFMAILTPPLVQGKARDGEKDIIKLRGKCIVARTGKTVLNGIKSKAECLKACLAIEGAKGCQYRKGNKQCKVVKDSFEKANYKVGNNSFRRGVTCWKFKGGEENNLLFLGPGSDTSGQSEVFSTANYENDDLTMATCTVPLYPFPDIRRSVGFIYEDFLHICGGSNTSVNPEGHSACFSLVNSTWSPTTPMLTERDAASAVRMHNGSVLVSGGWSSLNQLQSSELLTGSTWTPAIQLPSRRFGHCMLQLSTGELFIHGGASGPVISWVSDTHISEDHVSWGKIMSSKQNRSFHTCTEVIMNSEQQVWVGGPDNSSEILQLVAGTWTWTDGPDLPNIQAFGGQFVSHNGKIFYAGGYDDKNIYQLKDNWYTQQNAWTKIGEMSENRHFFPALMITEDVCKGEKPTSPTSSSTSTPVRNAAIIPPV